MILFQESIHGLQRQFNNWQGDHLVASVNLHRPLVTKKEIIICE